MGRQLVYRVEGFTPPRNANQMRGYGFSVYLDRKFARESIGHKVD